MESVEIAGITLQVRDQGQGRSLLYLHPEHFYDLNHAFVDALADTARVIAPHHPGFDGSTPPAGFCRVSDLAYLYLDLLERLDLRDVLIVGSSLGGWIALEMAVRSLERISGLLLIAPLGVKFSDRVTREFADLQAMQEAAASEALFHDPTRFGPHYASMDSDAMTRIVIERQYLAHYAWRPYLHNPGLGRWLHRVRCPVRILAGQSDSYVSPDNAPALAAHLPAGSCERIACAGHYPQIEQPESTLEAVATHFDKLTKADRADAVTRSGR